MAKARHDNLVKTIIYSVMFSLFQLTVCGISNCNLKLYLILKMAKNGVFYKSITHSSHDKFQT